MGARPDKRADLTVAKKGLARGRKAPRGPMVTKPKNLREQVYDLMRDRIAQGQLTFDERLVDLDIAADLNISRMPVREALMQLVHEGMLESTSRGFVLRRISRQEMADIFEIRRLLEPAAAASAATRMTPAVLQKLEAAINDCARASDAGDTTAFILSNAAFRGAWLAEVPNVSLARAIARYIDHVQAVRLKTLSRKSVRQDVLQRLRAIHKAFRSGKGPDAAALFIKHVDAAVEAFQAEGED
ncbi:GntR family transcriptional regulator [Methylocella sp. CPCC 101449]|uniref:GntR family transcriptional regulator n=1 Tax=Methylocella sp. CPCC 101449 TaxID=2987531 RepID=UPI00288EE8BB|nr:GntR family transcriptional regulator [Methylocella sp. CPCC 101449]MDT2019591.1 GntR family transcriptional regulator [Methylocella sp. CPCC 101449]